MSSTVTGPSSADAGALAACARALAGRVDADAVAREVAGEILAVCYREYGDDAVFVEALERSVRDNIRAIVDLFAGHSELSRAEPAGALAFADLSAALGIPVSTLERAYLVGAADFWRRWFDLCSGEDADLAELVREPTILLFAYIDHVLVSVVSQYDQARADMVRTREHLRRSVLAQILGGDGDEDDDPVEVERALAYPVRAVHVAVEFSAADGAEARRRAEALRATCDAAELLVHQCGAGRWTVWLARHDDFAEWVMSALRAALDGTGAVVSEPWPGIAGLRRTHEEVTLAATVQNARRSREALLYRDIRLDALLLSDPERARRFVGEELGGLARPDPRLALIREALLVWLSSGSHVAAAALLGVHENTVRNRVRQAEELLPRGVTLERRTELQVALRLKRVLG